jgi:dUTP pyrophosphatase
MIGVGAGVIDMDYRGEVKVLLFNHGKQSFLVKDGDWITQLLLEKKKTQTQKK